MKVNEFVGVGRDILIDVYDCRNQLVYSDFNDAQDFCFEQIEDEEIDDFELNSDRITIFLKDYEKITCCVGDVWYANLPIAIGDELGGNRMVRIEKVWKTRSLVTVTPVVKISGFFVPYFKEYDGTMTISIQRLQEKYEREE